MAKAVEPGQSSETNVYIWQAGDWMSWLPAASALLGAIIGVTSTLLTDRLRWRREFSDRQLSIRRTSYRDYLVALASWRNGMRETAYNPSLSIEERRDRTAQALIDSQAYERRMEMLITAPESVVRESEATYKVLKKMKAPIAGGLLESSTEYRELTASFEERLQKLRASMRTDLGVQNPEAGIGYPGIIPE
ncbi:hypothetical protein ABTY63_39955 [Streptomyces solisilvae]|uniref:hypothetical protein n=1 Tax=Streptomyces malaysiensis TaxID=92644 RepID=UPI0033251857